MVAFVTAEGAPGCVCTIGAPFQVLFFLEILVAIAADESDNSLCVDYGSGLCSVRSDSFVQVSRGISTTENSRCTDHTFAFSFPRSDSFVQVARGILTTKTFQGEISVDITNISFTTPNHATNATKLGMPRVDGRAKVALLGVLQGSRAKLLQILQDSHIEFLASSPSVNGVLVCFIICLVTLCCMTFFCGMSLLVAS